MSGARKPRIAFVTTVYEGTGVGGATFTRYLRRAVEEGALDLTFFTDDMGEATRAYERRVRLPRAAARLPGGFLVRSRYYHAAFLREHRERPFDLLWHNNAITAIPALLGPPGVPVVGMINDNSNAISRTPWDSRHVFGVRRAAIRSVWRRFEAFAARRLDAVVVNSRFLSGEVQRHYGVDAARVHVLYKAVALDEFTQRAEPVPGGPLRVLFVKSDYVVGRLEDLFAALASFPGPVSLTVGGPPPAAFGRIRALARQSGYRGELELAGRLASAEVAARLRGCDLLCVPSCSEALGVIFLEALATGTPVVACDAGGVPEALDQGHAGWVTPPGDVAALARVIARAAGDAAAREARVRHGREHVRRFSYDAMIDRFAALAQAFTAGRAARPDAAAAAAAPLTPTREAL
ncbi:MAG TPA: glycosyltransferase family 4 protein [Longimicrobium sp.]|nr:glycosyltransferase family 4 protein [Longimicrobium sp.]